MSRMNDSTRTVETLMTVNSRGFDAQRYGKSRVRTGCLFSLLTGEIFGRLERGGRERMGRVCEEWSGAERSGIVDV